MKNLVRFLAHLKVFVVRHRIKILDAGFIAMLLSAAMLMAFEVDVFENESRLTEYQQTLELDELMVLVTLFMAGVLLYTWRRARDHKRENERRIQAEKEVLSLAMQDPLTGLPNRRQFDDAFRAALKTIPAEPEAHAILLMDLNGFKKVNDLHGHPVGDQVLIHVGARLLRAVRDGDLVARLGGDEFVILARNVAGAEAATNIARRVIDCFATPINVGGVRHATGAAIGVAMASHDGETAEDLLRKADVALYRAKAERHSAVRFFEDQMDACLRERDELERALRTDLEREAFILRYEPTRIIDGQVGGFEATPRWPHPTLGELEADRFLPIAEDAGLLASLTEQLFRKACADAAAWPDHVRLAFNLPVGLLADQTFGLRLMAVLGQTGMAARRIDLEIDEGGLMREADAAQALLAPLRRAGVSVVADHFGTGYSDLQNLNRLNLDGIKIDRSFVGAMLHDRHAAVMVKALIGIAQGLDLTVVADGVGTEQLKSALAAQGVDQGQGALYGGLLSVEAASALVAEKPASRARKKA